jgi:hypothetical protein
MAPDEVLDSLVQECHVDHVGLWEVVRAVQREHGSNDPAQTWALTLELVNRLLAERGMQVGHPTPDGRQFVPWALSPDEAIDRIEKEWAALGREPDIGDVAWFTSPPERCEGRPGAR